MNIGSTIKKIRKEKGITQISFSKRCNISQTYLSQIENNERNPTIDILERISEVLEIPYPVLSFLSLSEENVPEDKKEIYKRMEKVMFGLVEDIFL